MESLIKEALEERAAKVVVPSDAWNRQKALLLTIGAAHGKRVYSPWWRRWRIVFEMAAALVLMVGLVSVGITYRSLRQGGRPADPPRTADTSSPDDLNPVINPPSPHAVVSPGLPALTPPEGSMTQEQVIAAGIAAAKSIPGGQLTLSRVALVDGRWELEFQGDGRAFTTSHGPRPSDPRKGAYSHMVPVGRLTYQIIGTTGEVYSVGTTGGFLDTNRTDLEHYRGYIVSGGDQTTLRVVRADGGREGRDLVVWVPGQALSKSGLDLWQLNYGTGRVIDVWGLTIAPSEVLAYRTEMKDRPGEELLDHDLIHGIPLPDGARVTKAISQDGASYTIEGFTVASLKAWYEEQMPRYGWQLGKPLGTNNGEAQVVRFVTYGWQYAEVTILSDQKGAQFTLAWGMTRLANQDQALAAVFRDLGDDPAFQRFPRIPGTIQERMNIGGPPPGATIPAEYETRIQTTSDGAWEVELTRSWGEGLSTIWAFRVDQDGTVHRLAQSGDQPTAIP